MTAPTPPSDDLHVPDWIRINDYGYDLFGVYWPEADGSLKAGAIDQHGWHPGKKETP